MSFWSRKKSATSNHDETANAIRAVNADKRASVRARPATPCPTPDPIRDQATPERATGRPPDSRP